MDRPLDLLSTLCSDLPNIDIENIRKSIERDGKYEVAKTLGSMTSDYEYLVLGGRLAISDLKDKAPTNLIDYLDAMKDRLDPEVADYIRDNRVELQKAVDEHEKYDMDCDWFSANTMITMYCAANKYKGSPVEVPQYTWLRVATKLHMTKGVERVIKAYSEMSKGYYTPASPTIFNAGMKNSQMSSCFLLTLEDSLDHILKGVYRSGMISKYSGGIGLDISKLRHSEISNVGASKGILPAIRLFNNNMRYVDQTGRRRGAATLFLRTHHIDLIDFISAKRPVGDKNARAHDLFYCLWTSRLFWKRVKNNEHWTLFCPAKVPHLNDLYGKKFEEAYIKAESDPNIVVGEGKEVRQAREIYDLIREVQRETGGPFLMDGDACNQKSNQRHLGYINCSNLCLEVVEYTDKDTIATCNLHSTSMRMFSKVCANRKQLTDYIDFEKLGDVVGSVVENIDMVIDRNWYPLDKLDDEGKVIKEKQISKNNKKHRPMGIGVSGFAELLHSLDLPFTDPKVILINKAFFACMYWNALAKSVDLAILDGPHESFPGSPASDGLLQFDLWREEFEELGPNKFRKAEDDLPLSPCEWGQKPYPLSNGKVIEPTWESLKEAIMKYGLRNSLLIALMPTASTAQIRRNCETVEAHQSNIYSRDGIAGIYTVMNRYMVEDLKAVSAWNKYTVEYLKNSNGSLLKFTDYIKSYPKFYPEFKEESYERVKFLEQKYRTMWELPQRLFIDLAADRGRYVDQSASMNLYYMDPKDETIEAAHMYAHYKGLKTMMYYLRQGSLATTSKFTVDNSIAAETKQLDSTKSKSEERKVVCTDEICVSCT